MSTILDALRKVEGHKPATSDAGELDRRIVEQDSQTPKQPARKLAVVFAAVLISALAGAGATLLGLSFVQERYLGASVEGETPPVAAAEAGSGFAPELDREAVPVPEPKKVERAGSVVVAAEVLAAMPGAGPARTQEEIEEDFPTALMARAPRPPRRETVVAAAAPVVEREPIVIPPPASARVKRNPVAVPPPAQAPPKRDPVAELAAAREARLSRAPRETPPSVASEARPPVEVFEVARANPKTFEPPANLRESEPEPLPVITRAALPEVFVEGTTWHPFRERRRASVSIREGDRTRAREVREGDDIGPYEVSEISPTGITLLRDGVEMQRRVGSGQR